MDLRKVQSIINKDKLLLEYPQEVIMEYFFGEPIRLKRYYVNPFRDDGTPGCTFFYSKKGVLVFNDFGLGKQFDCFQVASLRMNKELTFGEIRVILNGAPLSAIPKPKIKFNPQSETETTIKVQLVPFSELDLEFWAMFNVSESILRKFNVRRVERAWINGVLTYLSTPQDPCFRYLEGDKIKLYRPRNKRKKFRNNYGAEIPFEGTAHLPAEGDKLIITKSMKDIMVFDSIGLPAICPRSETSLIEEDVMIELFARFKEVFVWFDADTTGETQSLSMYERFKERGLIRITHSIKLGKDTSDIVRYQGINKLIELCKQSGIL